jgi:broad specificity phosphatase PhoE
MRGLVLVNKMILIRHVETDLAGTFCGHSDPDLNAAGERRLRVLLEKVAHLGITRVYSSDLRRAARTAMAIGKRIGAPVELRPGLREIHFGLWEGLRWEEIQQNDPDEARLWVKEFPVRCAPGGEPYRDFVARIEAEFRGVMAPATSGARALVTHRGVMQYLLTNFVSFSPDEARKYTENYGAVVVASVSELGKIDYTGMRT